MEVKELLTNFVARLTSRKFLIAVVGVLYALSIGDVDLLKTVVLGYLAAEGAPDVAERLKGSNDKTVIMPAQDTDVDIDHLPDGEVVTGNTPLFDEEEKSE